MPLSERAQDILERLWIRLAEHGEKELDSTLIADSSALKELLKEGLVEVIENRIRLRRKGMAEAEQCVRRHRLAERLLFDMFDIGYKTLHDTSCNFEHVLLEGLDNKVCTLLGHPRKCPHGHPIPPGICCREARTNVESIVKPLLKVKEGAVCIISYLHSEDPNIINKLVSMGFYPKTEIKVIQKKPVIVIQLGYSQFALDETLASAIMVVESER